MPRTGTQGHRRWPWLVLGAAGGGFAVLSALLLREPLIEYFRRPLSERDEIAGVGGMFIGTAALLVSIIGLIFTIVQTRRRAPATPEPTAPAAANIMYVTASAPLAVAQGVIDGEINNGKNSATDRPGNDG